MPQPARGHLDGNALLLRKAFHIAPASDECDPQPFGRLTDELLISVTAAPAQLMVKMRCDQSPVVSSGEPREDFQQNHRVRAAGSGDQDLLSIIEQALGQDGFLDCGNKLTHLFMLLLWSSEASGLRSPLQVKPSGSPSALTAMNS